MNADNIKKMLGYLKLGAIQPEFFSMSNFTDFDTWSIPQAVVRIKRNECDSPACVIGHCAHGVDRERFLEMAELRTKFNGRPNIALIYTDWSEEFTELESLSDAWQFAFAAGWEDRDNTLNGAISRLQAVLDGTMSSHKDWDWFKGRYDNPTYIFHEPL